VADSATAIIAGVDLHTPGLKSIRGMVQVVQNGVASFDSLEFDTICAKPVELGLVFSAPALPRVDSTAPLSVVVAMPSKPKEEKNELKGGVLAFMLLLAAVNSTSILLFFFVREWLFT